MTTRITTRHVVLAIGILVFLMLNTSLFWRWHRRSPPRPVRMDNVSRHEIDDYIGRIAKEDFDTLVRNLNVYEDLVVSAGIYAPSNQIAFHRCLANRRLAKIFADIGSRPPAEASRLCTAIFEEKFGIYRSAIIESAEAWQVSYRTQPKRRHPLDANSDALHGAVFLSAIFCPVREVLRQVEEWEQFGRSFEPAIKSIGDPKSAFLMRIAVKRYAFPESLFLLNIYAQMLRDRCGDDGFDRLLPECLPTATVAFCAWDAPINAFDFPHQRLGHPLDETRVLREFRFHPGWGRFVTDRLEQGNEMLIAALDERLVDCAMPKEEEDVP